MNDKVEKSLANIRSELARIPQEDLHEFVERLKRHSYSARLDAHHSVRTVLGPGGSCSKTDLLVLSGRDATDSSGKLTLSIGSLLCGAVSEGVSNGFLVLIREPALVATTRSTTPSFATVLTSSTEQPLAAGQALLDRDGNIVGGQPLADVQVEVSTWKHDGTVAANTAFSWICTVEAAKLINIGG